MAEFALGLTKTAVEGTLSRVKYAIQEETKLNVRLQNDLVFITGEFQMMQSFLNSANTVERAKNQVVRTWVRQLRDLAFDVEDCVELVVNLDTNKSGWWWRLVPSCIAPPLPLDVAAAEIQQIKTRVEDVSQRNIRYNLFSGDNDQSATAGTIATTSSSTAFNILSQVWEALGKRRGTGDLKKLTTSEGTDLQVISLWGSCSTAGGAADHLGAMSSSSYIIREAYNDPEVCREFKFRAWVKLMHPFNPDEFINTLLAQFYINYHQPIIGADLSKKMKAAASAMENDELMQQVNKQRYLVVLEDVSAVVEWDAIKMYLPDSNNGSRVIVSTQHLRIALMCTGNPYQVSQLTRFSDGQSICAFSKKGSVRRSDLGEFIWQIRCGGVISMEVPMLLRSYEADYIRKVYMCIAQKRRAFEGVVFSEHSWVDVPNPFNLNAFAVRLFLNFQSSDFQPKEMEEVGMKEDQGVIERCCRYLCEADCLVVLNGLESTENWDMIKDTFFSGRPTKGTSSIIVITHKEIVAKHVDARKNQALTIRDLRGDEVLDRLLKDCTGSMKDFRRARLFYDLMEESKYWTSEFKLVGRQHEVSALEGKLQNPGVISVWGYPGAGKSVLVRSVYYKQLMSSPQSEHGAFSLVHVPRPFNLKDFFWRLLLDFCTGDSENPKEAAAVGLMKGEVDPIEACRQRLREKKCLVVIDGLWSKVEWDEIRTEFLSEQPTQSSSSCIIVITHEKSVAKHCVDGEKDRLLKVNRLSDGVSLQRPLVKDPIFLIGRVKEMRKLRNCTPGVTCLWGIAGVGKSALARSFYDHHIRYIGRRKQFKISWVDVPHPFNRMEFSRRLLLGFYGNQGDLQDKEAAAVGIMEGQDTIQSCCRFLRQYKCTIIIDGLASKHDWDLIKADFFSEAEATQSSYIIAITTSESVATHCTSKKTRVHNVKGLNTADALDLFRKIAWSGRRLAPDERKFSEDIMAKCGGLPKIIDAIGKYIAEEIDKIGKTRFAKTTLTTISEDIHHDFMGKLERDQRFNNLNGLFSWMQSYFDACSDSLKPCIFYLSVFPADYKRIRRMRLLRRWIAEGYSRDTFGGGTVEKAEKLFDELVESSIIQQQQISRSSRTTTSMLTDKMCLVNGFFHEYIISRPMEDNLVFALEGRCSLNSQRMGQHLTIRSSWNRDKIVFQSLDFTRLRSLTVFGEWMPFFISRDINMTLLRVLDLEDTESGVTDDDLKHIGKLLPRLKFLSLRGCKNITRLPHSLGCLRQLQTLDVKHTKIVTMPRAIIKLVRLQYVRADPISDEGDDAGLLAQDEDDCASTSSGSSSEADDGTADGDGTTQPGATSGDGTSQAAATAAAGDGTSHVTSRNQPAAADGDGMSTSQPATTNGADTSTSQPAETTTDGDGTSQPTPANGNGASTSQPVEDQVPRRSGASDLVSYSCSWSSKKTTNDGGVKVPAGIWNLTALHTLGVVKVSGSGGKAILKEMKKLTQLRKLRVSGINRNNRQDLCSAISGHDHLESLSVRLDKEEDAPSFISSSDAMFSKLPKTLKSLKLYTGDGHGNVQVPPVLIKQLGNLNNLRKANLEMTISTQEDIYSLWELPHRGVFRHLCVKPIEDGQLYYGRREGDMTRKRFDATVLKIDCARYKLEIVFGKRIRGDVEVVVVHCSTTESSLQLSGLGNLQKLKEVWLKGSYSEAVKQHLQQEVGKLPKERRRVLKLKLEDQPRPS